MEIINFEVANNEVVVHQKTRLGVTILEEQNRTGDFVTSGINFHYGNVGCALVPTA